MTVSASNKKDKRKHDKPKQDKPRQRRKYQKYSKVYVCSVNSFDTHKNSTTDDHMESLQHYEQNVRQFLSSYKIRQRFTTELVNRLLRDEEIVSYLMFAFMKSDCQYKPDGGSSKLTMRYNTGVWFILSYIKHEYLANANTLMSLDYNIDEDSRQEGYISKDHPVLMDEILAKEKRDKILELIRLPCLSQRDKTIMNSYFIDGQTYKQIGGKYGVSKERTRQIINKIASQIWRHIRNDKKLWEYWQDYCMND